VIRSARREDAAPVAALWRDLLAAHAALDPAFALQAGAGRALERELARALGDSGAGFWVAELDGGYAGFCSARLDRSAHARESCRVEITEIWVTPDRRRSGVGTALAEAALAWAREQGVARVEVRVAARNAEGGAFWRALGFGTFVDVLDRRL